MTRKRLIERLRPWGTLPQRAAAKAGRDIRAAIGVGRPVPPQVERRCPCGGEMAVYSDGHPHEDYIGSLGGAEHWVVYCRTCGYITYDPTPEEASVAAFYDNAEPSEISEKYPYYETAYGADYVHEQAKFVLARLNERAVYGERLLRIFDFGCGDGHKVDAFNRLQHDAWGADVGGVQIERGQERGNDRIALANVLDRCDELSREAPFDLLHMYHVLEHLTDPTEFLSGARKMAGEETAFFIAVPNAWYLRIQVANLMSFGWHTFPTHLHFFSPPALLAILEGAGWRPLSVGGGSHGDPFPDELFMDLFRRSTRAQFDRPEAFVQALEENLMACDFWILACADSARTFRVDGARVEGVRNRDVSHWLNRPRAG